jgi:tetratricopeptide (TPR) repeat protein
LTHLHDKIEDQFEARSLFDPVADGNDSAYSETFYPFSSFGWSPLHSLETSRYHFIDAPQAELYDEVADPAEKHNLAAQQRATVSVMKDKLEQIEAHNRFNRQAATGSSLSPDAQDKLRALGYFGFHAPVSAEFPKGGLADPKDKISEFNTILKAEDAFHEHRDQRAEAVLREVEEQDPNIYVIPFMLGESALRRQDWQGAANELERCLVLNPSFDNAMTGLARALSKLGRMDEAKTWLEKAVQLNPENYRAWYEIGLLETTRNPAAALANYQKAVTIQPNYSPGQRELGMALFQAKDYRAATAHLEQALALGLDDAHLRNFLGICYSQTNHVEKSIGSYQAALKLDPHLAEAHLNLAYELRRLGRVKEAETEYATACQLEAKFCGSLPPE